MRGLWPSAFCGSKTRLPRSTNRANCRANSSCCRFSAGTVSWRRIAAPSSTRLLVRVPPMSAEQVADLVAALAEQHDMLRARFSVDDAGVIVSQRYLSAADGGPSWGYYDWRFVAKAAPSCCVNGNRGLIRRQGRYAASFTSLTAAPRLRADVLRVSSSDRRCGFWRVIVSDLQRLHQGNRCRQRHQLPPMGRTVKAIRGNPARPMRLLAGDDRRAARLRHAQRRDAGP